MTNENLQHHEALSPSEAPLAEPIHPFSQETIELIGQPALDNMLSLRCRLEATRQDMREFREGTDGEVQGENIGRRMRDNPGQSHIDQEMYAAFSVWGKVRVESDDRSQLTTCTKILYDLYNRYNGTFIPLSPEAIDEDIAHAKHAYAALSETTRTIEDLFAHYDGAENSTLRRDLLRRISNHCIEAAPIDTTTVALLEYITAERIFAQFERLEAETGSTDQILKIFNEVGVERKKGEVESHVFARRSPSESREQLRAIIDLSGDTTSFLVLEQLGQRCEQGYKEQERHDLDLLNLTATNILHLAEASVLIVGRDPDFTVFPYSLIDPDQINPSVLQSLILLDSEQRLEPLRRELRTFTRSLAPDEQWEWKYEELLNDLRTMMGVPLRSHSVDTARRITGNLLSQHLENVQRDAQPLADVVKGRKPRVPKNPKKMRPEHLEAQRLHNELHRLGFEDQEKAAIVAITGGQWDKLKHLQAQAAAEYVTVAGYAAKIGHGELVDKHPLKQLKDFSLIKLLAQINVKFALSPGILYGFNPAKKQLIDVALEDLSPSS